ncbi:MAG: metallophosphoesterase [Saprospiraceae bacterium]
MPINAFFIIVACYLILDIYTHFGLKSLLKNKRAKSIFSLIYIGISCWILHAFYIMYGTIKADVYFRNVAYVPYLGIALTALITKLVFTVLMFLQDSVRYIKGLVKYTLDEEQAFAPKDIGKHIPTRRRFLTLGATMIAGIPLSSMWYGLTKGKYNFVVNKVQLAFKDLPEVFEGFTIAQFSDLHAGGLDNKAEVQRGMDLINEQNPDLILFTGDLVNSVQEEVNPFMNMLTNLQAKQGKYAVLGNHDYHGAPWDNDPSAKDYWNAFSQKYDEMGFQLLNNEHVTIEKAGQNIKLVGVENWSIHDWFPRKGDLDKALEWLSIR